MSKLLKLLKWVTVPEAARHLSIAIGEPVSEADVFQLAIDKQIVLSINFVNGAKARRGWMVPIEEARTAPGLPIPGKPQYQVILGEVMPDNKNVLEIKGELVTLWGVFDLPMLGAERLDVQHRLQTLTNGPEVTTVVLAGAFVVDGEGVHFQLQDHFRRKAAPSLDGAERPARDRDDYFPAGGVPNDAVFVVRTDELMRFQASLSANDDSSPKELSTRESDTLLKLLIGMAVRAYKYTPALRATVDH